MKKLVTICVFALMVVLLFGSASTGFAATASFQGLGDLLGGDFYSIARSVAVDVSAEGLVVVGYSDSTSGWEAFRWTEATGMVGLGDLPGGSFCSHALDISADGSVVVGRGESASGTEAFRRTPATGMVGIGDLPNGAFGSYARGISGDGSVVVGRGESASGAEAFRWTEVTGMVGLGDLPGGLFDSIARDISADGTVVVGVGSSTSGAEAFRWTEATGMVGLGDLPGGSFCSVAERVSADGSVIVGWSNSALGHEAFLWTEATGMVGLGDLPGSAFKSEASGVSANGSVVVGEGYSASGYEAFIWDAGHGLRNLKDVLESDFGLDLNGWTLIQAQDMSDDGLTIVGHAVNPSGDYEGWIATLPGPGTYYVDEDANGVNDGSSWADAFNHLQDGLGVARYGDEIWVAEGIYRADEDSDDPNGTGYRTATFQLISGVAIYGGFPVGGSAWEQRDPNMYETILSGDLNGNDGPDFANNGENSHHVVSGSGTNDTAVLDGFTITGGNANEAGPPARHDHGGGMSNDGGSPTVRKCTFSGNSSQVGGGGMFNGWSSNPKVTNCRFIGNSCDYGGGGMANDNHSSPILTNCLFSGNRAGNHGGGLANWKLCNPNLINCTFSNNESGNQGGGINNCDCTATVTNCILWGNTAPRGAQIYNDWAGSATVTYSDIQGGWTGEGNINEDPCFVDTYGPDDVIGTEDDNLRLFLLSPCIDAGDNSVVEPNSTDLDDNPRITDGDNDSNSVVDMGAYELLTPIEADVHIVPRVINRNNRLKRIIAIVRLPEGISKDDVIPESFKLYVGGLDAEPIGAIWERVIGWDNMTRVFALFDKGEVMNAVEGVGRIELTVVGKLESGQYIQGSDTIRILQPRRRRRGWLRRRW